MKRVLICGGGGFIGGAMAIRLKAEGYFVRVADIKEHEFLDMRNLVDEVLVGDLCDSIFADEVCAGGVDELYQFAADMGGAGYIFTGENDANDMHNSSKINLNMAEMAVKHAIGRVFYSSSACMYPSTTSWTQIIPTARNLQLIRPLLIPNMAGKSCLVSGFGWLFRVTMA